MAYVALISSPKSTRVARTILINGADEAIALDVGIFHRILRVSRRQMPYNAVPLSTSLLGVLTCISGGANSGSASLLRSKRSEHQYHIEIRSVTVNEDNRACHNPVISMVPTIGTYQKLRIAVSVWLRDHNRSWKKSKRWR